MRFLKKFDLFKEEYSPERSTSPTTKPATPDTKPGVRPGKRPSRPSPIRRTKPGVSPRPKAGKEKLPTATIQDVIEKFAKLTNQKI